MEKNEYLCELRKATKMNRREFADYFGIPYRTVQDWELCKRSIPEYLLRLIEYKLKTENMIKKSIVEKNEER
ncbi:helix-turn-helix domain-containing protein [[Clostridium] polysaccharolyticum]|jgi:DNA-binding transcriptional regulator YiaG|uniref:Helix-turn-helix n=1 Tax=[Clostridium] polysaccharolyticum TaxID=29364 RepID=A0A1I0AYF3_9FIRM|nr:transcriptional regulator [[Clostridium] polysaccharolyticum]SES98669.1 hypothetical protein SAMN04487772_10667 [[Clostridium] polysaccharolyticum]